jgi:metal-dependent amidase/aminoacylase/carboxypeptidase family protein
MSIGVSNSLKLEAAFPFNCEDFAYFTRHIPGAMYWLGASDPSHGKYAMLHTPDFDIDESCLKTGMSAMSAILWNSLQFHSH